MKQKFKKLFRLIFGRTAIVALLLIIQIFILVACVAFLREYFVYIYGTFTLLSVAVVIYIINERENPMFKLAWMIPVLLIPVFGALLYLFVQLQIGTKVIAYRLKVLEGKAIPFLTQDVRIMEQLTEMNKQAANLAHYMNHSSGFPTYGNTSVKYFSVGEEKFAEMKKQIALAEKFIFLEYFIIDEGIMWNTILDMLVKKVKEGVEVRVMYDGTCSIALLPYKYPKKLERLGIRCKMFSPIKPALSTYQNNRDHRKILVIDGHTAFTGGINLADEYINEKKMFGHWKDTAIMINGDGVKSFTSMFLTMWNVDCMVEEKYENYIQPASISGNTIGECFSDGFVAPYGDSPVDKENISEQIYMDIINTAKNYVHIMTPYLILDNEMMVTLEFAAKRGVEVIIMMPHIPDKWYAYFVARTYYPELIEAGVKIVEYTPGFVHAKVFVSDNEKAVVGTINLDYRSLYLHFECGAYLYHNSEILTIEKDFQQTLNKCQVITLEDCRKVNLFKKIVGRVFRLFAPLM